MFSFKGVIDTLNTLGRYLTSVGIEANALDKVEKAMLKQHQTSNSQKSNITKFFKIP